MDILRYRNFHQFFEARATALGQMPCLTDGENTAVGYSYAELNEKVNQAVGLLRQIGIHKGDRYATLMLNCPEFFFLYFASMKMGALIMPLIADLPQEELTAIIKNFQVKALFVDASRVPAAVEAQQKNRALKEAFVIGRSKAGSVEIFSQALSNQGSDAAGLDGVKMSDPGSLYLSSGTTGQPKGIPQSPLNLLTAASALAKAYGFSENDTQMGILPAYHTALATYGLWPSICIGSNFVILKKFSRADFWARLAEFQASFVEVVPAILSILLNPPENVNSYDLSRLKFIGSGSAPLSVALQRRFEKTFNVLICNKYGLSETAPTHFNPPYPRSRRIGSIGKPLAMCESRIFNENDRVLSPGRVGEIVIRGKNVIKRYYDNPVADKAAFRRGWFHTGDLGYTDRQGWFFIVGRKKEMINRGGAKIYPLEVDNLLNTYPGIAEAASFAVDDEIYGEEIAACVVPKRGIRIREPDLFAFCRRSLPEFKCPKKIFLVDDIPKTASGKILRRRLSGMFRL